MIALPSAASRLGPSFLNLPPPSGCFVFHPACRIPVESPTEPLFAPGNTDVLLALLDHHTSDVLLNAFKDTLRDPTVSARMEQTGSTAVMATWLVDNARLVAITADIGSAAITRLAGWMVDEAQITLERSLPFYIASAFDGAALSAPATPEDVIFLRDCPPVLLNALRHLVSRKDGGAS